MNIFKVAAKTIAAASLAITIAGTAFAQPTKYDLVGKLDLTTNTGTLQDVYCPNSLPSPGCGCIYDFSPESGSTNIIDVSPQVGNQPSSNRV